MPVDTLSIGDLVLAFVLAFCVFVVLRGLRMPKDFFERQKERKEIRERMRAQIIHEQEERAMQENEDLEEELEA